MDKETCEALIADLESNDTAYEEQSFRAVLGGNYPPAIFVDAVDVRWRKAIGHMKDWYGGQLCVGESARINRYDVGVACDWHVDADIKGPRRLSGVVVLSGSDDFTGGQLYLGTQPIKAEQGVLTVFKPTSWHQVTPVETGRRYSLALFLHG